MKIIPFLVFIAAVLVLMYVVRSQYRQHRAMPEVISLHLVRLRVISSMLILLLLGMLLFSRYIITGRSPWFGLAYWGLFLILLIALMGITLIDLRELRLGIDERQLRAMEKMIRPPSRNGEND